MSDAAAFVNDLHRGTWAERLGLVLISATRDEVRGYVDIAAHHRQPYGIVHGGVYASIVESVASVGAGVDIAESGRVTVGLENHTSFLRATRDGRLHAVGTPLQRGRRAQLWEVAIRDDAGVLVATGRLRLMVLDPDAQVGGSTLGR